jgi:hypothetical protein
MRLSEARRIIAERRALSAIQNTAVRIDGYALSLRQAIEQRSLSGVRVMIKDIRREADKCLKLAQAGAWGAEYPPVGI